MTHFVDLVQVIRGDLVESVHRGAAVVCRPNGEVIEAWGDPDLVIYPRSSCKMIQALPLVELGLEQAPERLALACASHNGAALHVGKVRDWLAELGLSEADLRCGTHRPMGQEAGDALVRAGDAPCPLHNNCSGKHAGFLAVTQHLGAGPDYHEIDHPLQQRIREAFEEVTGFESKAWAPDGCSAPNFTTPLVGLATAMARFAAADPGTVRGRAMVALREAMVAHPDLVAGEGRACTELMRAMDGVAVKTGAEAVYTAILPQHGLGVAVKIADGGTRAAEAVIAALLTRLGALQEGAPIAQRLTKGPICNAAGQATGGYRVCV